MTQEHRYSLTRVCLRRGELSLPRDLIGRFADGAVIEAVDSRTGSSFELLQEGDRLLRGLGEFFEEYELRPNDTLLITVEQSDQVKLTARKRERRPQAAQVPTAAEISRRLLDAAPLTEAEARALMPGIPEGFDLKGFLSRSDDFTFEAGRWHAADRSAAAVPSEEEALAEDQARSAAAPERSGNGTLVTEVFSSLGFGVTEVGPGRFLLDSAPGSSHGWRAVMQEAEPGRRLDWGALLEERRRHGAEWLGVSGQHGDLLALVAPAGLAQATLWPEHALQRLAELSFGLPISPVDLEPHFRAHGLWEAGLQKFERAAEKRIAERGAFSTVLSNLARLGAPAGFSLAQAARGVEPEAARLILLQLSRSPFQLVLQQADGSWYLRGSVHSALSQLAEYATSLLAQMPRAVERAEARAAGTDGELVQRG